MARESCVVFHIDLIQDVAVIRPLIKLAVCDLSKTVIILLSPWFKPRDPSGIWMTELEKLCNEYGIVCECYENEYDVHMMLKNRRGLIIAGSESDLSAHAPTHRLFRSCPPSFVTVTLQHGFECVGFLHNAGHDSTAGSRVSFAADVIVGWFARERLVSVSESEKSKLLIAGPPAALNQHNAGFRKTVEHCSIPDSSSIPYGLVCENLHSVRFAGAGIRSSFFEQFEDFCKMIASLQWGVHLRPHPAGQFSIKNELVFRNNVFLSSAPLFSLDLRDFRYVISAPSSVLFDFILADVPVAMWSPENVDSKNWTGLHTVLSARDWFQFALETLVRPEMYLDSQRKWLLSLGVPGDVRERYCALLMSA